MLTSSHVMASRDCPGSTSRTVRSTPSEHPNLHPKIVPVVLTHSQIDVLARGQPVHLTLCLPLFKLLYTPLAGALAPLALPQCQPETLPQIAPVFPFPLGKMHQTTSTTSPIRNRFLPRISAESMFEPWGDIPSTISKRSACCCATHLQYCFIVQSESQMLAQHPPHAQGEAPSPNSTECWRTGSNPAHQI